MAVPFLKAVASKPVDGSLKCELGISSQPIGNGNLLGLGRVEM